MTQQEAHHYAHDNLWSAVDDPSSSTLSAPKQNIVTYKEESSEEDNLEALNCYRLERFYLRTILVIFVPPAVTAYYYFIWRALLTRTRDAVKYGREYEIWIFYSWFLIGVFGLNLSKYGLVGVEAAMLQDRFWQVRDAMSLLMHSGSTWSGPGGWLKSLKVLFLTKRAITHRLWYTLAFVSAMSFIALPLSGLCMELTDGYISSSGPATVIGRTWDDFNRRQWHQTAISGLGIWGTGTLASVPGVGIAYTPPDAPRDQFDYLQTLPNTLPLGGGFAEYFLGPQADAPIDGRAWGLRIQCNCSIVKSASEFTILSQKSVADAVREAPTYYEAEASILEHSTPTGEFIYSFNSSYSYTTYNLWSYSEVGLSNATHISYDGSEPSSLDSASSAEPDVLEYAIWQVRLKGSYGEYEFDETIDTPFSGLGQPFAAVKDGDLIVNSDFFKTGVENDNLADYASADTMGTAVSIASPIGVRCLRASALGHADLDGQSSTFTGFTRTSSPPLNEHKIENPQPRFGATAADIIQGRFHRIFQSTSSPPPLPVSNSVYYNKYVQSETLLHSIMRAHAIDALQLMYDGIYSFEEAYLNHNLTSARVGKVLEAGVVPAILPAVLFAIWAAASVGLGVIYGFRRRWSESLDGYSLFRFGADFSNEIRGQADFSSLRSFDRCDSLQRIPGLVGDARGERNFGHISLVQRGNEARKEKWYS